MQDGGVGYVNFVSYHVGNKRKTCSNQTFCAHADNKHLFDGKATNKDAFEKIEQFTKACVFLVKRRRGACKRIGLVANGTLSSQTKIPRIPNRNFPKCFVNGKRPGFPAARKHLGKTIRNIIP